MSNSSIDNSDLEEHIDFKALKQNRKGSSVGGSGEDIGDEQIAALSKISYDEATDKLTIDASAQVKPSTMYLGSAFSMSNAVQAVGFRLADGTDALSIVNRFDPDGGSYSNPRFFALGPAEYLTVSESLTHVMPSPVEVKYTTAGNNLTYSFQILPASAGKLRVQYWLGENDTGSPVVDFNHTVTQAQVDSGQPVSVEPNFYVLAKNSKLFVRFSGINLRGGNIVPWFKSKVLPYKEVTLNNHVELVSDSQVIFIGCDYAVDHKHEYPSGIWWYTFTDNADRDRYFNTSPTYLEIGMWIAVGSEDQQWTGSEWILYNPDKTVRLTVPAAFTSPFRVYDLKLAFTLSLVCIVDFSAFSQGEVIMNNAGDDISFFYVDGDGWYLHDRVANTKVRI